MLLCLLPLSDARAETRIWNIASTTTGEWFTAENWNPADNYPQAGDAAIITNGYVLLTNATAALASFSITNATLIFTNWATALNATTVIVQNAGTLTLPLAFPTNQMSNRVWVVCSNFTLNAGGTINAIGKGFAGGGANTVGWGPGGGGYAANRGAGGGHGGKGGMDADAAGAAGGIVNDVANAPALPGSGGGGAFAGWGQGGGGGGLVMIQAAGIITVNGTIAADGAIAGSGGSGSASGGGAGGAINISCQTFGGSSAGRLSAAGGSWGGTYGGGGGGGRIAVIYTNLAVPCAVSFSTKYGIGDVNDLNDWRAAQIGTIYFPDLQLLTASVTNSGGVLQGFYGEIRLADGITNWGLNALVVSNADAIFSSLTLSVTNELAILTNSTLGVQGGRLNCLTNLIVTNGGALRVHSIATPVTGTNYGALVNVSGSMQIASNGWVYVYSHTTNGFSPLFQLNNLSIAAGGGINANGKGFAGGGVNTVGWGPGGGGYASNRGGGGGHGGKGGRAADAAGAAGGIVNDVTNAPALPGSGGGGAFAGWGPGGWGGGLVMIQAAGIVTVNGMIAADGEIARSGGGGSASGGGAGGAINISCQTFGGSSAGRLSAAGGSWGGAYGGGGGGGRIAVWVNVPQSSRESYLLDENYSGVVRTNNWPQFTGTLSVTNGTGWENPPSTNAAYPGAVFFFKPTIVKGTMFMVF